MALLGLGAFHGINPGMGWLFAVALGLQEQRRSGCALLVGAFLVILLLKVLLDVAEFVLRAVLAAVILIFHHPALGIAFAFALIAFVILIARWAGAMSKIHSVNPAGRLSLAMGCVLAREPGIGCTSANF
jgi:hypothetical protein